MLGLNQKAPTPVADIGGINLTSPTVHTYSTEPHGGMLFPVLAQPTGDLGGLVVDEASADRGVMMPTRKQTREQDRRDRIAPRASRTKRTHR